MQVKLMASHLEALHNDPLMWGEYDHKLHSIMGLQLELEANQVYVD